MACQLRIDHVKLLKLRDPIIFGVKVTSGTLEIGNKISVPSKDNIRLGFVSRITSYDTAHRDTAVSTAGDNTSELVRASEGENVVVTIDAVNGEAPKIYMRHFDYHDMLEAHV